MSRITRGFATVEETPGERSGLMVEATYEIRVAGAVPEQNLRDMGAVTLAVDQVNTILYSIPDQSALYGLLARLRALGIEVVEVRRILDPSSASTEWIAVQPEEGDDESK
jgi:hypothetical protein